MCVPGKNHPEELEVIKFDIAIPEEAALLADEMSNLVGATTTERADNSSPKKIRDQAYTHLKSTVDELRQFGQYVFWRNAAGFRGYRSEYTRRSKGKTQTNEEPVGAPIA